jgi:hypothetical protein
MRTCTDGIPVIRSSITVSIPAELKQQALRCRIPFSATLEQALVARIDNLEREGGKPVPAPGYLDAVTTEADPC